MRATLTIAVLFLSSIALAVEEANLEPTLPSQPVVNVESLSIVVSISRAGDANITEDYRISFGDEYSYRTYQGVRDSGAKDLATWQNFSGKIAQNIRGGEPIVASQRVSGFEHLILTYSAPGLAQQTSTQGKYAVLALGSSVFTRFSESNSTALLIPEKTALRLVIEDPRKTRDEPASPLFEMNPPGILLGPYEQQGSIVFLANGPLTANDFSLKMKVERTLSESLSLQSLGRFLAGNPLYAGALALLVVLAIVFRKQVFGALSEITGEEEIQPPKREA